MSIKFSTLTKWFALILVTIASFNTWSITITKTRLFLDPSSKTTSMSVYNTKFEPLDCKIELRNLDIQNGLLVQSRGVQGENPDPSRLIKLAPKRFKLGGKRSQEFKAIYRRRPGVEAGEFIGSVAIKCSQENRSSNQQVTVKPTLVHNVPIVVRTGNILSQVQFTDIKRTGNKVEAGLLVEGGRSVTGDIRVIDASSGEVLAEMKRVSYYPNFAPKKLSLEIPRNADQELNITFSELKESGDIQTEQAIN